MNAQIKKSGEENVNENYLSLHFALFLFSSILISHILKSNNCSEREKIEKKLLYLADACSSLSVTTAVVVVVLHLPVEPMHRDQ